MKIDMQAGRYVVAVSGGVDSMVLLHLLTQKADLELIVAHVDHGIRKNSAEDALFVAKTAKKLGLQYAATQLKLGAKVSEATARQYRYAFLRSVKDSYRASAIITAHHQDDVIETMMINLLRGTNRKGLSSLSSTGELYRPLLAYTKKQIVAYAHAHNIAWRDDPTNIDEKYTRNYVRHNVVAHLNDAQREQWLKIYQDMLATNRSIDQEIEKLLQNNKKLKRSWLLQFPNNIGCEIIAQRLRELNVAPAKRLVQDALIACKVGKPGSVYMINNTVQLEIGPQAGVFCKATTGNESN